MLLGAIGGVGKKPQPVRSFPLNRLTKPGSIVNFSGSVSINPRVAKTGRKASLGIRPEDIHIATAADAPEYCFEAEVEVVEQLGSEILLDMRAGGALMVASVEPTLRVRAHDKLKMALKPERLHLFDAETEAAI